MFQELVSRALKGSLVWMVLDLTKYTLVQSMRIVGNLKGQRFPGNEISSLHDINLPGGRLPPMLWRWFVSLLSQETIINE